MKVALRGLRFGYPGGPPLIAVDALELEPGAQLAVRGPSGSGKSTLLHLMAGILSPGAGQVWLDGADLARCSESARRRLRLSRIGLVFQGFELAGHLSALDNILVPFDLGGLPGRAAAVERARVLAARAGIAGLLARRARRLSHGERQRVATCRALVTGPSLVLADEPTASLDGASAAAVMSLLLEAAAAGAVLVLATHDPADWARLGRQLDLGVPS